MSVHKYTSWGRTRRPKNIAGADGTAITPTSTSGTAPTTSATAGYRTENQRYLHLNFVSNGSSETITIYSFNYAMGVWGILMVPGGSLHNATTDVDSAFVPATISTSTTRKNFIFDISGSDRIAIVRSANSETVTIYAACSTF